MNIVQPIRDIKKIEAMKMVLKAQSARNQLLFVQGINMGLRISDILVTRRATLIDSKNRPLDQVTIKEIKRGQTRLILINKSLKKATLEYIEAYPDGSPDDYIYCSRKGINKPITREHAWDILNTAARTVGIKENIGTHTLRKTWGYHAYKSGYDIALIQAALGLVSPKVTLRYIGITQDDINRVYVNVNL